MKILAIEKEVPGAEAGAFEPYLKAEAKRLWELYRQGTVREVHFKQDRHEAVLVLECTDAEEAKRILDTLPLVKMGLIMFHVIPLVPYPGFERLFEAGRQAVE